MKIDGTQIASEMKRGLKEKADSLRQKNILPYLAVILIGDDPNSIAYIKRKQKAAEEIGVKLTVFRVRRKDQLTDLINSLNSDPSVHGIIIQRPIPINIAREELDRLVISEKDVDGFHPKSPFDPPVASAVIRILEWVNTDMGNRPKIFLHWLKKQKILIIGRGETGGKPIAKTFKKMGIPFTVVHSQTKNIKGLCLTSDIIISCVGKPDIVRQDMITDKSIIIGVGLHAENGKFTADYDQEKIGKEAKYYTPVPGGIGPVNVACLFINLLKRLV